MTRAALRAHSLALPDMGPSNADRPAENILEVLRGTLGHVPAVPELFLRKNWTRVVAGVTISKYLPIVSSTPTFSFKIHFRIIEYLFQH